MHCLNLKELLDELKSAFIITSKDGSLLYKNKEGKILLDFLSIDGRTNIFSVFKKIFPKHCFKKKELCSEFCLYSDKFGEKYYFEVNSYFKKVGEEFYCIINIHNTTKYMKKNLENEIFKDIFYSTDLSIVLTDYNGNIENVNNSFEKLTGYNYDEIKGKNLDILNSGYYSGKIFKEIQTALASGETWRGNLHHRLKSGEFVWEKTVISPIKDDTGKVVKYVYIKDNITKDKLREEALRKYSYHDYLTGVYNRRGLILYSKKITKYVKKRDINLFCLMIDVDNFKSVNDNFGHEIGDKVLIELAEALKINIRDKDIAARYGGEEFVVLLTDYSYKDLVKRVMKIKKDIQKINIRTKSGDISISVSIGFSIYDKKSSIAKWFYMADKALYKAKKTGKNKICEFRIENKE